MKRLHYIVLALCLVSSGCATFYQRNIRFQELVAKGDLDGAEHFLDGQKQIRKSRNVLLYDLNKGFINHLEQDFVESNKWFNQADLAIEDYKRNYGSEALALISNPEVRPYKAEDFEAVMIHYYKALNYLNLGDYEAAVVEAKRINLKLLQLNDKYPEHKNRYSDDAFGHILMGLAFEGSGKINDAFIAYRNAYNVYTSEHGYFGIKVPEQLKQDLMRTAYLLGFGNDLNRYEKEFGVTYEHQPAKHGEVVFFWQNGFGPVKAEWSVNFFAVPGNEGYINFSNEELGVTFPFYIGDDKEKRNNLLALKVIRVAFPKYLERPVYYHKADLSVNGKKHTLEKAQDINAIAFKTLNDRFAREMATSLLRLALKKAAELELSKQNEALGAMATIANAITEKADTRNWQTLPHTIYYTRVQLEEGMNDMELQMKNLNGNTDRATFHFEGHRGKMIFFPYHSIEHLPAASWDTGASVRVTAQ